MCAAEDAEAGRRRSPTVRAGEPPVARSAVSVLGSARGDGNAARLLAAVLSGRTARAFDLGTLPIGDYAYDRPARDDGFLAVAEAVADADAVLFVTPVYWYAMSATLKRFFDRLTDLVTVRKPLGRRLAGGSVWVAACGSDPALPDGFEVPFQSTASYFGMSYGGAFYVPMREGTPLSAQQARRAAAFGSRVVGAPGSPRSA